MAYVFKDNEELSIHNILAIVKGTATQKKHHFYGSGGAGQGEEDTSFKNYRAATYPVIDGEKRIPMNKVTKNPLMKTPNVADLRFRGALPIIKMAMDQIIKKPISVFQTPQNGASAGIGQIQSSSSESNGGNGSENTLQNIVSSFVFGSGTSIGQDSHQYESLSNMTFNVGKMIGADANTNIATVKDDEVVALAQGIGTMFSNAGSFSNGQDAYKDTDQSFSKSVYSEGLDLEKEVQKYIASLLV